MKTQFVVSLVVLALAAGGCATKVIRTSTDVVTDYSGTWNDTDVRLVADQMIRDCLAGMWLYDFTRTTGRVPTVIVGTIQNNTFEHIDARLFINDLEQALINSGRVQFVASRGNREEVRAERADQMGNAEPSTISAPGHETGADFMLQGNISAVQDAVRGKYAMFYQVTLNLIDMKTNQKRWVGKKEIKKVVLRPQIAP